MMSLASPPERCHLDKTGIGPNSAAHSSLRKPGSDVPTNEILANAL
jgi:hypothetical protein